MLSPRILYVEDDDDIRGVVTQALLGEGFEVTAVSSAEDALQDLAKTTYQVMLTDYRLPGENAPWLLREGKARGFLSRTPVIVLSSEVDPTGIDGYTFLRKPVDLDILSAALAKALSGSVRASETGTFELQSTRKLVLTLYVTNSSHVSQKAIRNLHRVLQKFDESKLVLVICDVARLGEERRSTSSVDEDRIVVTPTLVVRTQGPKVWIAGDLSDSQMVEDVITRSLASLATDS